MNSFVKSGDSALDSAITQWLNWDKNEESRKEVEDLVRGMKWSELSKHMLKRLKFGTAGLRGEMAAGVGCMNDVVVLQTAQGLCSYLKKVCNSSELQNGVVVGYDGRYNSKRFAELTAKVFTSSSIPVYLFFDICPTPFVSFATIKYSCIAGVMVTASHNPKQDNGYKVYWGNGSQIITPHDDNILRAINDNLDIPDEHWDIVDIRSNPLVKDCFEDVMESYREYIKSALSDRILKQNKEQAIPIVYSAMHGVGHQAVSEAFKTANLKEPICVVEQRDADPEFPTVHFPNPEERECLNLGRQYAEEANVQLLLVNDPDADRLAVAEYNPRTKEWKIFSGDEMGVLLGWWILKEYKSSNIKVKPQDIYFIASVVSSNMLRAIAKAENCQYVETLTGFKWMGNKTHLLLKQGKLPMFAFEEAIGYMCSARVPDKDGVSAAVHVASLATDLYARGSNLVKQLEELYKQYGYYISHNFYYICHDQNLIKRIFDRIRNYDGEGQYPKRVGGLEVVAVQDLVTGVKIPCDVPPGGDSLCDDVAGTGLDIAYTAGEMMTFRFGNSLRVTVRTSGTEPKLKLYTEMCTDKDPQQEKEKLVKMVEELLEDLIEPTKNGLVA